MTLTCVPQVNMMNTKSLGVKFFIIYWKNPQSVSKGMFCYLQSQSRLPVVYTSLGSGVRHKVCPESFSNLQLCLMVI